MTPSKTKYASFIDLRTIITTVGCSLVLGAATFFITTEKARAANEVEIKMIKEEAENHIQDSKKLVEEIMKTLKDLDKKAAVNETDHKNIEKILNEIKGDIRDLRS